MKKDTGLGIFATGAAVTFLLFGIGACMAAFGLLKSSSSVEVGFGMVASGLAFACIWAAIAFSVEAYKIFLDK